MAEKERLKKEKVTTALSQSLWQLILKILEITNDFI